MVKETYTFEKIADEVLEKFGVNVWFAEVAGKRWSYIAGNPDSSFLPPVKFKLSENLGLVVETDSKEVAKEVEEYVRRKLSHL